MTYLQAVTLGLLQGLTEFLPVSSSGHLAIAEVYFGIKETAFFTVALHFATLLAVIVYFRKVVFNLSLKQWFFIWLVNLPVMMVGYVFRDWLEISSANLMLVGWALLVTAGLNFLMQWQLDKKPQEKTGKSSLPKLEQMVKVGLLQMMALIPGISRSGTTIFAGLYAGVSRKQAFEFSFLLAIPTILVATGYQIFKMLGYGIEVRFDSLLLASLVAFASGYLALRWLAHVVKTAQFKWLGVYAGILGLVVLLGQFLI